MKFRKKPVVIDAARVGDLCAIAIQSCAAENLPPWVVEGYDRGALAFVPKGVVIQTLEGEMIGNLADWLIRGVNGEFYACKPDIFAMTYESVDG